MQILANLLKATSLTPALPQNATNGNSTLGTDLAPTIPLTLNNVTYDTTAVNTNPYENDVPFTNETKQITLVITRDVKAPDGFNKSMFLINGSFPGPLLEANWGDTFNITVQNRITGPEEGTSLHWHGLLQRNTSFYDGVPSVGQCPIAPGNDFTYTFRAGLFGTSWYHSHYSAQYADGLFGPMIIHGPNITTAGPDHNMEPGTYDTDLGPVMLSDWYHRPARTIVLEQEASDPQPSSIPIPDNNLINGKMVFDCPPETIGVSCTPHAGISTFNFTSGQSHRLRLINSGAEALQRFTIDNHQMTVIAIDYVPVKPYVTDVVTLGVGQRTDVVVNATGKSTDSVFMRSHISEICTNGTQPLALAAIFYEDANRTAIPTSNPTEYDDSICGNVPLETTVPLYPYGPTGPPSITQTINITFKPNKTNSLKWLMNNSTFKADYNNPTLREVDQGNTTFPTEWNVYNFGSHPSVRIILYNTISAPHASHPMHLHGHNFFVLDEGYGYVNDTRLAELSSLTNPTRRDTHIMRQAQDANTPWYTVIQFDTDNPGVWPLHCHRAWHTSLGFLVNILEHPDEIPNPNIGEVMPQTCTAWDAYSSSNDVDEIDSGL